MIQKFRRESEKIQQLQAIVRRLPEGHEMVAKVKQELAISQAGYRGEQMIDYYVTFLPAEEYDIFQDLRLQSSSTHYFQMDILLVTSSVIFLLEVKNISGTLYFDDEFKQCIRIDANGIETGFSNPIYQVKRQRVQFLEWLKERKFPNIPIVPLVVIAHPSTIIKSSSPTIAKEVIHAATLAPMVTEIRKKYKEKKYDTKQLRRLTRLLKKEHTEWAPNYLTYFGLKGEDLILGVQCPRCERFSMERKRGTWCCFACGYREKNAHLRALADCRLLLGAEINNKKFREFLRVTHNYEASRMLRELAFPAAGERRGRTYQIPADLCEK